MPFPRGPAPAADRKTCCWSSTRSPNSLAIANHYIKLREIPAANVVYLPWDPKTRRTDIAAFRRRILGPLIASLVGRKLLGQIDAIVYSSDFPTAIDLGDDIQKFTKDLQDAAASRGDGQSPATWPKVLTPVGSLTGLTYLWEPVLGGLPGYMQLHANAYMTGDGSASRAFHGSDRFGQHGELQHGPGRRYLLAMMLGATVEHGNTLEEVLDYLRRSATADGTHPRGTIYYLQNGDVRSKARHDGFPAAVRRLKELGVAAEIVNGVLPADKDDVQGLMVGAAYFDWKSSHCTIRPGAICEHFTSFGGELSGDSGQAQLSRVPPLRSGRRQRHRDRTVRRAAEVSRPAAARALRPRLFAQRGLLPIGGLPLSTAHRGRSLVPAVGRHSPGARDGPAGQRPLPRHVDPQAQRHAAGARGRAITSPCSSTAARPPWPSPAKPWTSTPRSWPTAITSCAWWPWPRGRSLRKAA